MRVLVACEFSGVVRDAYLSRGHDAYSCDLISTERESKNHIQGNVLKIINDGWDLMIAHPPCTHLAVSGSRWFSKKKKRQQKALEFFMKLLDAPIHMICVENPISVVSSRIRPADQIIQPWQFGHGETKSTCLWLKNLSKLKPTNVVDGRHPRVWLEPPGPDRKKNRSRTYQGIANAMADQWNTITTTGFSIYPPHRLKSKV